MRRRPSGKWNPWPLVGLGLAVLPWVVLAVAIKRCAP